MTLKEIFQLAWQNGNKIAEGTINYFLPYNAEIKKEAERRLSICRTNICGYYDKDGKPGNAVIVGKPSCSICMCNDNIKTNCMSCNCALEDIGSTPLWTAIMNEKQEEEINSKLKHFL
jgi:hypothetical protein